MIACDVLDPSWCEPVRKALEGRDSKPVFIAEGLFMYLTFGQIRSLLNVLRDNFPEGPAKAYVAYYASDYSMNMRVVSSLL